MTAAAILGIHLLRPEGGATRVGTLTRNQAGATAFIVDETYLRDPDRPVLSLGWLVPGQEDRTRARLADRADKIGLHGLLPPWFSGLLPEGALRELVLAEMGPGDHDQFDLLLRLGADLPGAVLIVPETGVPASAGQMRAARIGGLDTAMPEGLVKFSLAGVQLKFTGQADGERLTVPGRAGEGRCIIKVPAEHYPSLPEIEFGAMRLAREIGVDTATCRLVPVEAVDGIPRALLAHGPSALVVDRFDRPGEGKRLHIEDAGQIVGAIGERKYTMGTTETVLNMIRRFSTDWRADVLQGMRRVVADVLLGNGDNHLKNWSFLFPGRGEIRLSPAYDIVPTVLYHRADRLALRFVGTHDFAAVSFHRFRRIATYLGLDPDWIEAEMRATVRGALEKWPRMAPALFGAAHAETLLARLDRLAIVQDVRG